MGGDEIKYKGIDLGAGGDDSVILTRVGRKIIDIRAMNTADTMDLVDWIDHDLDEDEWDELYIDEMGVGKGVVDRLMQKRPDAYKIRPVKVGENPQNTEVYHRKRDEIFWWMRQDFEDRQISIPYDPQLIAELTTLKYEINPKGQIQVEAKKEMRRRGLLSPNRADALAMTYVGGRDCYKKPLDSQVRKSKKKPLNWKVI
jgi:hypothetical protein